MLLVGCGGETASTFELSSCEKVSVRGNLTLSWQESTISQLRYTAPEAAPVKLRVEQQEDLVLYLPSGEGRVEVLCACPQQLQLLGNVQAHNFSCQTKNLRLYGESRASLAALTLAHVQLRASGQAQLQVEGIDVDHLDIQVGGRAQVVLHGNADKLSIATTNMARVDADGLRVQDVDVQARGESVVRVWPTAHISLDAGPDTRVSYRGAPELTSTEPRP